MKSLFESKTLEEIKQRINKLRPKTERKWGTMDVAQMMAHCSAALEVATDHKKVPRSFLGRIIGPFFKKSFYNNKPYSKNSPTSPALIISDNRNFDREKLRLIQWVTQFHVGGIMNCTREPHSFFGKLKPHQWAKGMYKHLDHHLRQFGV